MKHSIFATRLSAAVLVGFVLGFAVPTLSAADKETRQMMADIRMLQEQAQQLQNLIATLGKTMTEAIEAASRTLGSRLDSRLDEQNSSATRAFAGQKVGIDAIARDAAILRAKLDENNVRVGSLTQEVSALRQLVTQIAAARSVVDPVFGPPDGAPAAAPVSTAVGASPKAVWDQAFSDYTSSQYELAILGFEGYIKTFPTTEMTDDAQVYICNSHLHMGNNAKVIETCDVAIKNYANSNRLAEAYYRKGLAFQNMKRVDDARTAFEYIVKAYPTNDEAALATTLLASPELARRP